MSEGNNISILLTTYNSSNFLGALLDSIITQTYKNWRLFIRDDGSLDNTNSIIIDYTQKDSRIILLKDEIGHRGPKDGFIWLMSKIESKYYMFCDHDDIWLPQKIEITLNKILNYNDINSFCPIIIHTDLVVVNEKLEILHPSFWQFSHSSPEQSNSFRFHCAYNNVTGCTMLFNKKARDLSIPIPKEAYMHDSWISLVVSFHGGIITYVNERTILYRQHSKNTLGAKNLPSFLVQLIKIKQIMRNSLNQYRAICALKKISLTYFFLNKMYFYLKYRTKMFYNC